jgi:hypothetical protein
LETDSESALEDEKHSGGADACCIWCGKVSIQFPGIGLD